MVLVSAAGAIVGSVCRQVVQHWMWLLGVAVESSSKNEACQVGLYEYSCCTLGGQTGVPIEPAAGMTASRLGQAALRPLYHMNQRSSLSPT